MPENFIYIISSTLLWITVYAITLFIGNLAHKLIGGGIFGPINFLGGGLIGAVKGLLIVFITLQIILIFPIPQDFEKFIKGSDSVKVLNPIFEQIQKLITSYSPKNTKGFGIGTDNKSFFPETKRGNKKI